MFSHLFCSHLTGDAAFKWLTRCPVSLPLPREGNHRHSGRSEHPNRPAPLPCCPCPHSSPPNQCLPTDTSRPFITFLTASVQPQNRAPEGSTAAPNHAAPSFALSWKKTSTRKRRQTVWPEKKHNCRRKAYLSTQRCSRVEVVGYPQHPQHGKT